MPAPCVARILSESRAVEWLYPLVVCPACHSELTMDAERITPSRCTGCDRVYPWLGHIPVLVEQEAPDPALLSLAQVWNGAAPSWSRNLSKPAKVLAAAETPLLSMASGIVLEVGCGDGRLFPAYETRGLRAIGLDFSAVMLQMASDGGFPLVLADAHRIPLRKGCVDTVLVPFATIRYLDYQVFFKETFRVLKPGGVFGFIAWNAAYNGIRAWLRHRVGSWRTGRDVARLKEILVPLAESGFDLVEIHGVFSAPRWSPWRHSLAWRVKGMTAARMARDIVVIARRR
ncbi:methyltransferase domain-containing protein [Candidatus Fermentibacteria bacterium]|nr:methyltransferase domain-containing protein [Candidatus Fermentibacteria bacterium]